KARKNRWMCVSCGPAVTLNRLKSLDGAPELVIPDLGSAAMPEESRGISGKGARRAAAGGTLRKGTAGPARAPAKQPGRTRRSEKQGRIDGCAYPAGLRSL